MTSNAPPRTAIARFRPPVLIGSVTRSAVRRRGFRVADMEVESDRHHSLWGDEGDGEEHVLVLGICFLRVWMLLAYGRRFPHRYGGMLEKRRFHRVWRAIDDANLRRRAKSR